MEPRNRLQQKKGVPARTAPNVYSDTTLVFGKQISDVLDRFAIGRTDIVVLICYPREMLVHIVHV